MEFRTLGLSGLRVSAVGLGCMGMTHAYSKPANKKDMTKLLAEAVDVGYTFFDTSEIYGTSENPHLGEELLGEALSPYRDKVVIATKCGIRFAHPEQAGNHDIVPDGHPETIRRAVEGSLRCLRTDHINLYYQHRTDKDVESEVVADTMSALIKEGKVLHWGISETTEDYLRRAHKVCPVTAIQNRYSMMARWHERLFPVCEELGVGFVAFSPLANGLLTECYNADSKFDSQYDYRAVMPQYRQESFAQNKYLFEMLDQLAESHHTGSSVARMDALQEALDSAYSRHSPSLPHEGKHRCCRHHTFGGGDCQDRQGSRHNGNERSVRRVENCQGVRRCKQ